MDVQQCSDGWTTSWCPSDSKDTWDKKSIAMAVRLEELGWTDSNVKYRFNEYGYRHQGAFVENRNSIVFLGCSLTFGIGINYEQTWPYYVAEELGLDCINLAQPGTGINASYRAAKMWLPVIKPKVVMFYVPDPHRRELWPDSADPAALAQAQAGNSGTWDILEADHGAADSVLSIGPWVTNKYKEYFKMYMSGRETAIWREAYMDAMRWICRDSIYIHFPATMQTAGKEAGIPNPSEQLHLAFGNNTDGAILARDMMHPGPRVMRNNIAPLFIRAYNES